ncbi:unnamed protein product, partial [Rotaria sordida]
MEEIDYIRGGLGDKLLTQITSIQEKTTILIQGKSFVIYPNVFNPIVYSATLYFTRSLLQLVQHIKPQHMLELGTGAGYNAILGAFNGATYVTCTDVSQVAVNNAQENIDNHQLGNRVTVIRSDFLVPDRGRAFFAFSTTLASMEQFSDVAAKNNWKLQLVNEYETTVGDDIGFEEAGAGAQL